MNTHMVMLLAATSIGTMSFATAASAQSADPSKTPVETPRPGAQTIAAPQARAADSVDDIVVTARKVNERLQDVPISVAAFTAADLQRRGIREVSDLSNLAPGLTYEKDFGRRFDRPTIRGQSNILGSPNAASFIDGVFIPDSLFSTELAFVDRVEVIKGPQSALYGRQTFSGAISYVTKKPTDNYEATFRGTIAERGEVDFLATANIPIVRGKVAAQIAGNVFSSPGYYRNTAPGDAGNGRRLGNEDTKAVSGILRITPTAALDISLRASYSDNDDGVDPTGLQRASVNNCFPNAAGVFRYYCGPVVPGNVGLGLNTGSLPDFGGNKRQTTRLAGTAAYDLGPATLTLISGYNDSREQRQFDLDFLPLNTGGGSRNVDDYTNIRSFSQEVRLASPGSGRFNWIVGGYYYHENRDTLRLTYSTNALQDNGRIHTRNIAGFGLVRYKFTDTLSASAEIRQAEEDLALTGGGSNFNIRAKYISTNPRFTVARSLDLCIGRPRQQAGRFQSRSALADRGAQLRRGKELELRGGDQVRLVQPQAPSQPGRLLYRLEEPAADAEYRHSVLRRWSAGQSRHSLCQRDGAIDELHPQRRRAPCEGGRGRSDRRRRAMAALQRHLQLQ